jgi:hypothetical protein
VLDWFRTILPQDAVELRRFYPDSPLWSHAPFNTLEFRNFQLHLETAKNVNDLPMELRFKQLMPQVANQIQGMKEIMSNEFGGLTNNQQRLGEVTGRIDDQISEVINRLTPIEVFTGRFARGEFKWITHLDNAEGSCFGANDSSTRLMNSVNTCDLPPLLSANSHAATPSLLLNGTDDDVDVQQVPEYEVNNNLRTVKEMWEEWDQGLICNNSGIRSPSIRYLEEKYGTAWRTAERSRKQFFRRKLFIQQLQTVSRNLKLWEVVVAHKMENWRQSTGKGMTLDKLQKTLQANPSQ